MEHVQRLYERLRLTEPRGPQTWRTSPSPSSSTSTLTSTLTLTSSFTSLHRPRITRSHTFAGPSTTSASFSSFHHHQHHHPHTRLTVSNGPGQAGAELHRPDVLISSADYATQANGEVTESEEVHDLAMTEKGLVPASSQALPLPSSHPARSHPLPATPLNKADLPVKQGDRRRNGWTLPPPVGKADIPGRRKAQARGEEKVDNEASSSGVSSDDDVDENEEEKEQEEEEVDGGVEADKVKVVNKVKVNVKVKDGPDSPRRGQAGRKETPRQGPVDILQLREHLRERGLGEPQLSTHSHNARHPSSLPPGVRARCLPRDPSTREKIKGRARLDYEMANLRAVAFCEQQRPRVFRTASAVFRDRDLRLLEEEERENVQRGIHEARAGEQGVVEGGPEVLEEDDDDSSLVGSPLTREELFLRIEAWADDVDKALNRSPS